jgi:DNA-binding IclR family transcriptional regulator
MLHENYLKVRGNRYSLGLKVVELGRAAARSSDLLQYAGPTIKWIAQELNESVQLASLDGTEVLYLSKCQPRRDIRLESKVGERFPSYATALGKALLSTFTEEEIDEKFADYHFEKFTPRTISSLDHLKRELEGVRLTGFARDRGEYMEDVICYARTIKDHNNRAVASISVSMPKDSASYRDWVLSILSEGTNSLTAKVQAIS